MVKRNVFHFIYILTAFLILLSDSNASKYPLGCKWKSYNYGEITIHVPQGFEDHVFYTAQKATAHLDSLEQWFDNRPDEVHIILNPWLEDGGAFASILPNRIEIPIHPALDKGLRPQAALYLDRVLMHELGHIVQLTTVDGWIKPVRSIFGEVIAPVGIQPGWTSEGLCILAESNEGGGRLNSNYYRMIYRSAILEGKYWTLAQAGVGGMVRPPAEREYVDGTYMVKALWGDRMGQPYLAYWLKNQSQYPFFQSVSFKKSFEKLTAQKLHDLLESETRTGVREMIQIKTAQGYVAGQRIAEAETRSYSRPAWNSKGNILAYEEGYDNTPSINEYSARRKFKQHNSLPVSYLAHKDFTPYKDGIIIPFIETDRFSSQKRIHRFCYLDSSGSNILLNGEKLSGWSPAWSEANKKLAWVGLNENNEQQIKTGHIYSTVFRVDSIEVIATSRYGSLSDPTWSNNGEILAFTSDQGDGEKIILYTLKSKQYFEVHIKDAKTTWDPAFANDGKLWVSADKDSIFDLYEIDILNRTAVQKTRVLTGAFEPAPSPDGQQVVYSHYSTDGSSLGLLSTGTKVPNIKEIEVSVKKIDSSYFNPQVDQLSQEVFGLSNYRFYKYIKPRFWLPFGDYMDEFSLGAMTWGRDPLGLLEYRSHYYLGTESLKPDLGINASYRELPVNIGLYARTYVDEGYRWRERKDDNGDPVDTVVVQRTPRRWEAALTFSQTMYFNDITWKRQVTPYTGWITRQRHIQTSLYDGLESRRYQGFRFGFNAVQWRGAILDPVPSKLYSITLNTESRLFSLGELDADHVDLDMRAHFPLPVKNTVLGLAFSAQTQSGVFDFTRINVLPRGMYNADLPFVLKMGKMYRGSTEVHFPIIRPDAGLGMGGAFLHKIDGMVFCDLASGWGNDESLTKWAEENGVAAFGAQISPTVDLFYNLTLKVGLGASYRTTTHDMGMFFSISFPSELGLILPDFAGGIVH